MKNIKKFNTFVNESKYTFDDVFNNVKDSVGDMLLDQGISCTIKPGETDEIIVHIKNSGGNSMSDIGDNIEATLDEITSGRVSYEVGTDSKNIFIITISNYSEEESKPKPYDSKDQENKDKKYDDERKEEQLSWLEIPGFKEDITKFKEEFYKTYSIIEKMKIKYRKTNAYDHIDSLVDALDKAEEYFYWNYDAIFPHEEE